MADLKNVPDKKRLTCPICSSTFLNIFPAGKCGDCDLLVCGHCLHHDNPDHQGSICQDCIEKNTPYGRVARMDPDKLLIVLKDPSSQDSSLVARVLGEEKDPAFVDPLCQALASNRTDVQMEAATALGKIGSSKAVPVLLNALDDASPGVRSRAASSLAELGAKEALPQLKKQLEDSSLQAAGHAVAALAKLMGHDACDLFKNLVQDHGSSFIRCEALAVLAGLNHELALASALECLDDPKKDVIISACKILAKLNDLEAAPKLEKLSLEGPSASVRMMAKTTLNKLFETNT